MVTASQEERGISHGQLAVVESNVVQLPKDRPQAPWSKGKEPAREEDQDPYQIDADRTEERRDAEDADAPGPSTRPAPKRRAPDESPVDVDHGAPPAPVVAPNKKATKQKQRKTPIKRTRNQRWEDCSPQVRRERDSLIEEINRNWDKPRLFWPEHLKPRAAIIMANGPAMKTKVSEALEPRDVSTKLLTAIASLSSITRSNVNEAHKAMKRAVDKRIRKSKEPEKLLPEDVDEAYKLTKTSINKRIRRASNTQTEAGAVAADVMQSVASPSRQLQDEMAVALGSGLQGETATTPDAIMQDAEMATTSDAHMQDETATLSDAMTLDGRSETAHSARSPSPSPEVEYIYTHPKPKSPPHVNESTSTMQLIVPADSEWSEIEHELQQLFIMRAKYARTNGKNLVISLGQSN
ncbi:hypothetical protein LTR85_010549 [Meristemomyces frigidus]|nr:hypothetical protein LTR85_010549 [Meristemomyces frigidus]